ncbi:unnamed protein product [Phytophthora fragariaefolia]|uniref:Unnamed protein product n=1 Tax=Phytophthora fragariaefolia TaxID=1490495 RepID=A0A9W6Y552_9STRA|nr:unnamed protein product [Phytophthora fragariaefolia]
MYSHTLSPGSKRDFGLSLTDVLVASASSGLPSELSLTLSRAVHGYNASSDAFGCPIQVPDTATFRQLQNIDRLSQEMQQNHQAEQTNADTNFRLIRIFIRGAVLQAHVNVANLREILGLPSYSIRPPFRDPVDFETQAPADDIEDVDHMEEQQDNV